ncbi:hypothetical protein [Fusobacterium necrophorum]|uniref:hypothetical protein n=1 Tax=Fusobacterium necrophorum TaxID=859 RepID=UPI00370DF05A
MEIDYKNVVLNLMSQEANFQTNKKLIQLLGKDLADLTSYLLDQYSYHDRNETLQEDSSFFCSNFDIYLFSGMKMETIIQSKKRGIEQQIFKTVEKGIPKATYYYLNFKKIFELVSTKKTVMELAYERALKEGYLPETTEEKLSVSVLEKWSFKDLRLFCKKEKISYTGKDRKEMLIQKILEKKCPENLVNEIPFTSEQKNCSLWKNGESSDLVNGISLTSEQKNCSQVSKKVVTNQELINQELNKTITTRAIENSSSHYSFLDLNKYPLLNLPTKKNIEKNISYLTEEEFQKIYNATSEYIKNKKGKDFNFNAILYQGLKQEWSFIEKKKNSTYTREDIKNELAKYNILHQRSLFEKVKEEFFKVASKEDAEYIFEIIDNDITGFTSLTQLYREWIKVLFISKGGKL